MSVECDVVVLGTGVAGLTAALAAAHSGASVKVFEKSPFVGGTSAMSGGIIWMPNNHLQEFAEVEDSRQRALAYLDALSLGQIDSDMASTFVDKGPEMLQWVEEVTPCSFHIIVNYPDCHPEHPGGLPNGGPKTDVTGRVLSLSGGVIPGLYAAGNAMAAPTGMVYGGAGGTLGPAMTFGYIAGGAAASNR